MAGKTSDKDRIKLARKWAALYRAVVDLSVIAAEITGEQAEVQLRLDGDNFQASVGSLKFGAKQGGL